MNRASEQGPPLQAETVYSILADEHRRAALRELHDSGESGLEVAALTKRISERVADDGPPGPDARRQVRVALHHVHLPKLAEAGLIVYDLDARRAWNAVDQPTGELLETLESTTFRD